VKKPKLGQNFLVDATACERIADSLGDIHDRTVVEIGPGHGAITALLSARSLALHCVELDPALVQELRRRFEQTPNVVVHHGDILKTDFRMFLPADASATPGTPPLDIIGNLPYYITSDILLHLFVAARAGLLRRAVVMMQREVAERIAAPPGTSDYGPLSAFTQLHAAVTSLFTLGPLSFSPPPDVDSTVLRLEFAPRFHELDVDPDGFNRFLRAGFAQKRKTLANNLRAAGYSPAQVQAAWPEGIASQARAEVVSLEALAAFYRALGAAGTAG
jgi:16S rRNA (adenine1518-N6/adenine1519-N6)-dimethyltransferase